MKYIIEIKNKNVCLCKKAEIFVWIFSFALKSSVTFALIPSSLTYI